MPKISTIKIFRNKLYLIANEIVLNPFIFVQTQSVLCTLHSNLLKHRDSFLSTQIQNVPTVTNVLLSNNSDSIISYYSPTRWKEVVNTTFAISDC